MRCSLCHGEIGASARACLGCLTLYHDDCAKEHGRCPTLGCSGRKPRVVSPRRAEARAQALSLVSSLGLWLRLFVLTTIYTMVALVAVGAGLALVFGGSGAVLPGVLLLGLACLAVRAINRERVYQNRRRSL
jgi:hypothetical protein